MKELAHVTTVTLTGSALLPVTDATATPNLESVRLFLTMLSLQQELRRTCPYSCRTDGHSGSKTPGKLSPVEVL